MTNEAPRTLSFEDVLHEAKLIPLSNGAAVVLEFATEITDRAARDSWTEADRIAVRQQAIKQARRIYNFLGYTPAPGTEQVN